ncbi:hypothetical protein AVEN_23251-1 [Araneus ventricosus]|uniref:Uncharacterized protein n=1 Tax=Araneus ventricosus TaxID=182803 RepID=A0A4Y2RV19_ARAVE|nr:hypothetical protein AVEN_23251-1 [Araneus ventricosus]
MRNLLIVIGFWVTVGSNFFIHARGRETEPFWESIRESLGETTPSGCSCGGIGTALHYATECIYTVSWHMRKPAPNLEQERLKRVANNLVSRHKIRGIVKFISENRDLFRPP